MSDHNFAESIRTSKKFFDNATRCFDEADSTFAPKLGMFTLAQQVAHTAQAIEWFVDGAFRSEGMDTNFEAAEKAIRGVTSLKDARAWMDRACAHAIDVIDKKSAADLERPIAGAIMAGDPRKAIFEAIADHTAHHRGALAVYARLIGKVPPMPYT